MITLKIYTLVRVDKLSIVGDGLSVVLGRNNNMIQESLLPLSSYAISNCL